MTLIITLLLLMGLITSPEEFNNLSQAEQTELTNIIINDDMDM